MNQSFVKMLNRIAEVENRVLKGLVLDDRGQWVPIADKKAVEEEFCAHLAAGQVLHEGRWVGIAQARAAQTPTEPAGAVFERAAPPPEATPGGSVPAAGGPAEQDEAAAPEEETCSGEDPRAAADEADARPPEFAPETRMILSQQPRQQFTSEDVQPPVDPASGYAPETGLFILEQTPPAADGGNGAAGTDRPPASEKATTALLPSLPSWEFNAAARRKKILLIGIAAAALAGLGAVAVILIQAAR